MKVLINCQNECKLRRSQPSQTPDMKQDICLFCLLDSLLAMNAFMRLQDFNWTIGCVLLHASLLPDTELLGRLKVLGTCMGAIEARYHSRCLGLYSRARKANLEGLDEEHQPLLLCLLSSSSRPVGNVEGTCPSSLNWIECSASEVYPLPLSAPLDCKGHLNASAVCSWHIIPVSIQSVSAVQEVDGP